MLQMQNWEHVRTVFAALNRLPTSQVGLAGVGLAGICLCDGSPYPVLQVFL